MAVVNCGVQRWTIHAPANDQYEKDDEGEWVEWDSVKALLWERDEARTEADELRSRVRELEKADDELHADLTRVMHERNAANALLERVQKRGPTRGDGALNGDIRAHLRGACPACGPGPCTPACPEREWRYAR